MLHIKNGSDLELEVLGQTNKENLALKFEGREPDLKTDLRDVISRKPDERFPQTFLAGALYDWVQKGLKALGVRMEELYLISSIGTMVDLFWETDCLFYLKTEDCQEVVVTIDLFFMSDETLKALREFWIDASPYQLYSQDKFHADLLRHTRIISELKKNKFELPSGPEELRSLFWKYYYKKLWVSDYIPQADILEADPARGKEGYQNQLVVTPYQIVNSFQRKVLAGFIAELLVRQIEVAHWRLVTD